MSDCANLLSMGEFTRGIWPNDVEVYPVLLGLLKGGLGRVAISKLAGLTERRARRIKEAIEKRCSERREECERLLLRTLDGLTFRREDSNGRTVLFVFPLAVDLLKRVESKVVYFRDLVVINVRAPGALEVIGLMLGGEPLVPGLPPDIALKFVEEVRRLGPPRDGLFTFWNSYRELLTEAAVLRALIALCGGRA